MSTKADQVRRWGARWLSDAPLFNATPMLQRLGATVVTFRHNPAVITIVPVLAVLACAAAQLGQNNGSARAPLAVAALFSVGVTLPLLWRRRFPLAAFSVTATMALFQWAADVRLVADIALLVALYSVAARYPPRVGWTAAAVVQIGATIAVIRWEAPGSRVESLVLLAGPIAAAALAGVAVRHRRAALASAVERGERDERERNQDALIALAAERARIAREMHDVVAHGLSIMVTMSEAAVRKLSTDPERAESAMRQVATTGREALDDMRGLLGVLRTERDPSGWRPQPGTAAIETLVHHVRETDLNIELRTEGDQLAMTQGEQLTAYRVVQEALTNVIKHAARPRLVVVTVRHRHGRIEIEVDDDGALASRIVPGTVAPAGFGLTGMAERLAALDGRVDAGPRAGGGWRVRAEFAPQGELR